MFYVSLQKDTSIAWDKYLNIHPKADFHTWFRRFSEDAQNAGYFGTENKLVRDYKDVRFFSTEEAAYEALEKTRFNKEEWSGAVNPVVKPLYSL